MTKRSPLPEPNDVLYRLKRGLSGYVSYLAACEMNESFSEYLLYEPILRILTARGFAVECEVVCPRLQQPKTGDKKRLDFVARKEDLTFAMEVKWAKKTKPKIDSDLAKLRAYRNQKDASHAYLCVFGRASCITKLKMPQGLREQGKRLIADFGKTKFGCRIYKIAEPSGELERVGDFGAVNNFFWYFATFSFYTRQVTRTFAGKIIWHFHLDIAPDLANGWNTGSSVEC